MVGSFPLLWVPFFIGLLAPLALGHYGRDASERLSPSRMAILTAVTVAVPLLIPLGSAVISYRMMYISHLGDLILLTLVVGVYGLVFGILGLLGYAMLAGDSRGATADW